jgi:guanosine-3',5'-bis(diphosphate) 3'-pyrophosphohydrolase
MERDSNSVWQRAVSFAARAHDGQFRKDKLTPYVAHPFRVAMTVRHVFGSDDVTALAAALLHDTIEDTKTDYDDLLAEFGREIADTVAALTKDMRLEDAKREQAYDWQMAAASWQAKLVKLGDAYDNYCDQYDEAKREETIGKLHRAIAYAGDHSRLQVAVAAARKLLDG